MGIVASFALVLLVLSAVPEPAWLVRAGPWIGRRLPSVVLLGVSLWVAGTSLVILRSHARDLAPMARRAWHRAAGAGLLGGATALLLLIARPEQRWATLLWPMLLGYGLALGMLARQLRAARRASAWARERPSAAI